MSNESKKQIVIQEVLELMAQGYTRTPEGWGSTGYDPNIGSIQQHYGIVDNSIMTANAQMKALFQHPKLKKAKTITPKVLPFLIVDLDEPTTTVTETAVPSTTTVGYTDDAEVTVTNFETETVE